jgi:hypothetical protein
MIDLRSFLASHKFKLFLTMKRTTTPFNAPKQRGGAHPPSGNPLMYLFNRGGTEKLITATFLKRKTVFAA